MNDKDKQFADHFELSETLLDTIPFVFCKDTNGVYRGCNLNQAKTLGFHNPSEFIGKTIFDILDDKESAIVIDKTDREIMQTRFWKRRSLRRKE
jgi:two-component system, OmpR family, aerobic respiration control sensor histidine kinase ArcB